MFKDITRSQAVPPQCSGKFNYKGERLVSQEIISRADLAVVKDETMSLPFFREVAGRSVLVKQWEICCYHKRKSKEMVCMQSILQEGIKILHLPLLLLGLTLTDT